MVYKIICLRYVFIHVVAMSINMICLYYNDTPIIYLSFSLRFLFYLKKNYSLYNIKKNALLKNNFRQTNESLKKLNLGWK
jgi:hypothetical protein